MSYLHEELRNLPRILYWGSLLILLAGAWMLIDPSGHPAGETVHIYTTLVAFELYIWGLMLLGRWQSSKGLFGDVARSCLFALVLIALEFMAATELLMASLPQGQIMIALVTVLAATKIVVGLRWIGASVPAPFLLVIFGWLLALALPSAIIRSLQGDPASQYLASYLSCWSIALLILAHLPLVRWQLQRQQTEQQEAMRRWFVPWVVVAALAFMAVFELYTTRWGLWVDWVQWFFSPIYISTALLAVTLAQARASGRGMAWAVLGVASAHAIVAGMQQTYMPEGWQGPLPGPLADALIPAGLLLVVGFLVMAHVLRQRWPMIVALGLLTLGGLGKLIHANSEPLGLVFRRLWDMLSGSRLGQGLLLLLLAFGLLGTGFWLQWWMEKRKRQVLQEPPPPSPSDLDVILRTPRPSQPLQQDKPGGQDAG